MHGGLCGGGVPNIASNLAQRTVAPGLELIYEEGVYGARRRAYHYLSRDPALVSGLLRLVSQTDLFAYTCRAAG